MNNFTEIIEKLNDILSNEKDGLITDKSLYKALYMSEDFFKNRKKRKSTPYPEVMQFLAKRKISINWFFFGQLPESLINSTSNYGLLEYNN